jgi:purine-binding chemotaxis protein CheW
MPGISAEALRAEFDGSFALPLATNTPDSHDLLAIRIAGRPYALRALELGGVTLGRRVTPLPSPDPALAGLVGVRGTLVGLFDLGVLLGLRGSAVAGRWVALAGNDAGLAFAFDELEGHLRIAPAALRAVSDERPDFVTHLLERDDGLRLIASVASLVAFLSRSADRLRSGKAL